MAKDYIFTCFIESKLLRKEMVAVCERHILSVALTVLILDVIQMTIVFTA
jgi:hypothetical protein